MNPNEVYVVYNNVANAILHVYPFAWMAEAKVWWYWENSQAPSFGTIPNSQKIVMMSLTSAIMDIKDSVTTYSKKMSTY